MDVDGDGLLTRADALEVINILNHPPAPAMDNSSSDAEGEGAGSVQSPDLLALAADEVYRDLFTRRRSRTR